MMNTQLDSNQNNNYQIDLQIATTMPEFPSPEQIYQWACAALRMKKEAAQMTIRVVDNEESAHLNQKFRHQSGPTNVLSFPFKALALIDFPLIGDVVICAPQVLKESEEQHKTFTAHFAHLVVHGVLHLLGYDHQQKQEAEKMEALEINILAQLGYANPYEAIAD